MLIKAIVFLVLPFSYKYDFYLFPPLNVTFSYYKVSFWLLFLILAFSHSSANFSF